MDIFSSDFHVFYRDCTLIQALKLSMSSIMIPSCERLKEKTLLLSLMSRIRAGKEGQYLTRRLFLPLSNTGGVGCGALHLWCHRRRPNHPHACGALTRTTARGGPVRPG
jgi:hypothetical protein